MVFKVAYIHNVCMHYKVSLLSRIASQSDICLHGFFGQSHWKNSKLYTEKNISGFPLTILPTIDILTHYKGRKLHIFWNPTLLTALCRFRPNVIVAGSSNFPNNFTVMLYAHSFGVPYIWHGIGSMYSQDSYLRSLFRPALRQFYTNATAGIAFNTVAKDYYVRKYGCSSSKIVVAPNIIDTEAITADRNHFASQVAVQRKAWKLEDKKVILFVGALEQTKRVDLLLLAYNHICRHAPNTALLIVGDGTARPALEHLSKQLGLTNIIFAGRHLAEASLYYMLGDVFVLPGLGGLAISHAMAHGLPIIANKADGTEQDLIIPGENGYILSGDNLVEKISYKVIELLGDDRLRRRMGQKSAQLIDEKFNIKNTVSIFYRVIKSVCRTRQMERKI